MVALSNAVEESFGRAALIIELQSCEEPEAILKVASVAIMMAS